jgi:hypothetical protein
MFSPDALKEDPGNDNEGGSSSVGIIAACATVGGLMAFLLAGLLIKRRRAKALEKDGKNVWDITTNLSREIDGFEDEGVEVQMKDTSAALAKASKKKKKSSSAAYKFSMAASSMKLSSQKKGYSSAESGIDDLSDGRSAVSGVSYAYSLDGDSALNQENTPNRVGSTYLSMDPITGQIYTHDLRGDSNDDEDDDNMATSPASTSLDATSQLVRISNSNSRSFAEDDDEEDEKKEDRMDDNDKDHDLNEGIEVMRVLSNHTNSLADADDDSDEDDIYTDEPTHQFDPDNDTEFKPDTDILDDDTTTMGLTLPSPINEPVSVCLTY